MPAPMERWYAGTDRQAASVPTKTTRREAWVVRVGGWSGCVGPRLLHSTGFLGCGVVIRCVCFDVLAITGELGPEFGD